MSNRLLDKNFVSFWKDWRRASQIKCPLVNRIEDSVTEGEITETFKTFFQQIFGDSESEAHHKLREQFEVRFPQYLSLNRHDSISPFLLTWDDMISISGKLKVGKSYSSFVRAEHILLGSTKLMVHLHLAFNGFLQHGFVPSVLIR